MTRVPSPAEWGARGECRTIDPDIFFPNSRRSPDEATAACARCPVSDQCLAWALSLPSEEDRHGVLAGLTPAQREKLRHPDRPRRAHRRTGVAA